MNLKQNSIHDNFLDEQDCSDLISYRDSMEYTDEFYILMEKIHDKFLSTIADGFDERMYIDNSIIRRYRTMVQKNGMDWHQDNVDFDGRKLEQRPFTGSIVLNKNFVGGQFKFKIDEKITVVHPKPGQLTLIRSGLLHGVEDVIIGNRYCLLLWARSDYRGDAIETHMTFSDNDNKEY